MRVRSLRLRDFRSHADVRLELGPGLNLLHGPNGAGKTNLLEALHYCCQGRSFVSPADRYAVRRGADSFDVEADCEFETRGQASVRMTFVPGDGKRIAVNGSPLERLVDAVGRFPVVAIAPDHHRLTDGGPEERRRFMDVILCQESVRYVDHLLRYRRALRQRNELLSRSGSRGEPSGVLASWTEELVRHGAALTVRRRDFVRRFGAALDEAYRLIERGAECPTMSYRPLASGLDGDTASVEESFRAVIAERAPLDHDRGLTHSGPHRDEIVFRLDGMDVRHFASHGQRRTLLLALKFAEYAYLRERKGETPLFLLDDVFDHLDADRIALFARILTETTAGQSLVTAARGDLFGGAVPFGEGRHRSIRIQPSEQRTAAAPIPSRPAASRPVAS